MFGFKRLKALFRVNMKSGVNKYLTSVESLIELEKTGTILIDDQRPGIVVAMQYLTMWNRAYVKFGDDRVLHAWCDKCRALINMRRGIKQAEAISALHQIPRHTHWRRRRTITKELKQTVEANTPVLPDTPLHIVVVDPADFSKPWAIGTETPDSVTINPISEADLNNYL